MRYSLRKATEADRAFAEELHEQCYRDVVTRQFGVWDPAVQRQFFQQKWQPEHYRIVTLDDEAVGVVSVDYRPDHVFLADIQIHPSHQGRGIGSAILADLFDHARVQKIPVRLQVLRCNRARALYERMGFTCCGQTDTHLLFEKRCF